MADLESALARLRRVSIDLAGTPGMAGTPSQRPNETKDLPAGESVPASRTQAGTAGTGQTPPPTAALGPSGPACAFCGEPVNVDGNDWRPLGGGPRGMPGPIVHYGGRWALACFEGNWRRESRQKNEP